MQSRVVLAEDWRAGEGLWPRGSDFVRRLASSRALMYSVVATVRILYCLDGIYNK
jgi:hypothetical protein